MWTDVSTFSRSEVDRTPTTWQFKAGAFTLVVHRHIRYPKDQWLLSINDLADKYELKSKEIKEAKIEALRHLRCILSWAMADISKEIGD